MKAEAQVSIVRGTVAVGQKIVAAGDNLGLQPLEKVQRPRRERRSRKVVRLGAARSCLRAEGSFGLWGMGNGGVVEVGAAVSMSAFARSCLGYLVYLCIYLVIQGT